MIEHCYLVVSVAVESKIDRSSHTQTSISSYPPPHRRDYYVCTGCGTYSCGGVYSSLCTECNGVICDPPRDIRHHYLCTECARSRPICTCDRPNIPLPPPPHSPSPSPSPFIFRPPPEYCWCPCCKCCTYTFSCSYCDFFCECLSSPCERYEPCCYCTRVCFPNKVCCKTRYYFWSWCPCSCSQPPSSP